MNNKEEINALFKIIKSLLAIITLLEIVQILLVIFT